MGRKINKYTFNTYMFMLYDLTSQSLHTNVA